MPGENLTRIEAQERAKHITVDSYQVDLDLTSSDTTFSTTTLVKFSSNKAGISTFIDAIMADVREVVLNGESLNPKTVFDGVRIELPNLQEQNELLVVADGNYMNTGEGLHRFVDPVDDEVYLYTQFEVPDSRRVFAVFEQPDLKATFTFNVTAPAYWKVVSNTPSPEPDLLEDGKALWSFAPTKRISSYITALIAGPYDVVTDSLVSASGRTIDLGVYCRKSLTEFMDADYVFEKTKQGFEFYENAFDVPYPFEKYDQLFVPEFNAGAMENAGAVTFTETYVFRSNVTDAIRERRVVTILHELAHMWFGDLVTMRWWNDLWLNESFAEYASTLATAVATEWHGAWTTFATLEKGWAYRQDQLSSTHPIVAEIRDLEDVQANFDGITYAKGASVLKQLVAWVGQDAFLAGVGEYFKKHAFGNTELKDLLVELEAKSGRDLSHWSKLWLETAGVNTLKPEIEVAEDGTIEKFAITQTAVAEHNHLRPHRLGIGFYDMHEGQLRRTRRFEVDVDGASTALADLVGIKRPDLILLNDDDLAYAKVRLDSASWKIAVEHLSDIKDSLARALIWGAAWDAVRDAEVSAREYVTLVLNNIANEDESTTILTQLRNLLTATGSYVAPTRREEVSTLAANGLRTLATAAKPASDLQLQLIKFFAQLARTEEHMTHLAALLNGSLHLEGLEIDSDLRWELLIGLTVGGKVSQARIDEELEKDNTSNGQRFAATASAAIPDAHAKSAMWDRLVRSDEYSNVLVNAASLGFGRVIDTALLEPYIERYFADAVEIWNTKTYKIAEYLITGLYPFALASKQLADATEQWLAKTDLSEHAALKRFVAENLDTIQRTLRAQAKDASAN